MIHDRTLLYSATAATSTITLPEPLSAFERYMVKATSPDVYYESVCTGNRSVQRFNRYGSYNNDGYMVWPANWVISNDTKTLTCNRFQLLMQLGTNTKVQTFGWNNTAGNIKNISEVWGINRIGGTTAEGEGSPGEGWKTYNETLLWSGTDWANQSHIDLANRAVGYERLKVGVGSFGESTNILETDAPQTYNSWLPLTSYWGTTTGSFYLSMHRYQWDNETSGLSAVSGKTWQLGTGAADPFSTTGNYTATDTFIRRPVWAIWGVNEKDKYKLIPGNMTGGTISANRNSGYEHDITTLVGVPESEDWKCSAINITGAELTGNDFMFTNSNVTAQAEFEHSRDLTLINSEHGTLSADVMTGFSGDVVTVDATTDEGWYFTGLNVTGATATGNQFMFVGNDVTAEGLYTDEGFPITYLSDEHVSVTGDDLYIPGATGIQLQSSYDPYYRIDYEITNGEIVDGLLVPTGPCTVYAKDKINYFTATGSIAWGNNLNGQGQGAREARPTLHINAYTGNNKSDIEASDKNYANYGHTGTSTAASTTTSNRAWKYSTTTDTCISFPTGTSAVSLHVKGTYTGNHAGQAQAYVAADQRRATLYVLGQSTIWDSFFPQVTNGNASKAFDITKTSATVNDTNKYIYFRIYNANDTTGTSYNCGNRWAYNRAVGLTGTFTATGILK